MNRGRTRLAHKAEHAVDLKTSAAVGVTVQDADAGDTATMLETLVTAAEQVDAVQPAGTGIAELVCDKGYHGNQTLVTLAEAGIRSYVSEPARGRRNWRGKCAARDAVYANRRRIRGARGKRPLRRRGERLERPKVHLYATGRPRPCPRRGHGARIAPLLAPRIAPSGAHAGKLGRIVVDSPHNTVSFTHSARAARRQFYHSLLVCRRLNLRRPGASS